MNTLFLAICAPLFWAVRGQSTVGRGRSRLAARPFLYWPGIGPVLVARQLEIFSATPRGNGLSPMLKAVFKLDTSQDETFCFEIPSFVAASKVSALGDLIRYLTLLPSFRVTERTIS